MEGRHEMPVLASYLCSSTCFGFISCSNNGMTELYNSVNVNHIYSLSRYYGSVEQINYRIFMAAEMSRLPIFPYF